MSKNGFYFDLTFEEFNYFDNLRKSYEFDCDNKDIDEIKEIACKIIDEMYEDLFFREGHLSNRILNIVEERKKEINEETDVFIIVFYLITDPEMNIVRKINKKYKKLRKKIKKFIKKSTPPDERGLVDFEFKLCQNIHDLRRFINEYGYEFYQNTTNNFIVEELGFKNIVL